MKRYRMSFGASIEHRPEHPRRTGKRAVGWDVEFGVFQHRKVLARTIRMQQQRERRSGDWSAVVPLTDGEGY